jgi:hypothetical protein
MSIRTKLSSVIHGVTVFCSHERQEAREEGLLGDGTRNPFITWVVVLNVHQ